MAGPCGPAIERALDDRAARVDIAWMTRPADALETDTGYVWLRPDGIVQTTNRLQREQSLEDANKNVQAVAAVSQGKARPLLVDNSLPAPLSRECQTYYVSDESAKNVTAVAILVADWFGRLVGNLMLSLKRSDVPMKLFESEEDATRWLREHLR